MIKNFVFTILIILIPYITKADKKIYENQDLSWIETIPLFPELKINKNNTIEFDSVNGKILIIDIFLNTKQVSNMESFYKNYFKEIGWKKIKNKKNILSWEKDEGENRKKFFFLKNKSVNKWAINYVVENF